MKGVKNWSRFWGGTIRRHRIFSPRQNQSMSLSFCRARLMHMRRGVRIMIFVGGARGSRRSIPHPHGGRMSAPGAQEHCCVKSHRSGCAECCIFKVSPRASPGYQRVHRNQEHSPGKTAKMLTHVANVDFGRLCFQPRAAPPGPAVWHLPAREPQAGVPAFGIPCDCAPSPLLSPSTLHKTGPCSFGALFACPSVSSRPCPFFSRAHGAFPPGLALLSLRLSCGCCTVPARGLLVAPKAVLGLPSGALV